MCLLRRPAAVPGDRRELPNGTDATCPALDRGTAASRSTGGPGYTRRPVPLPAGSRGPRSAAAAERPVLSPGAAWRRRHVTRRRSSPLIHCSYTGTFQAPPGTPNRCPSGGSGRPLRRACALGARLALPRTGRQGARSGGCAARGGSASGGDGGAGGEAVPGGVRQERPRFLQEMRREHRQGLVAPGPHGAGTAWRGLGRRWGVGGVDRSARPGAVGPGRGSSPGAGPFGRASLRRGGKRSLFLAVAPSPDAPCGLRGRAGARSSLTRRSLQPSPLLPEQRWGGSCRYPGL